MKLLRCAFCLSLVYASILARGDGSPGSVRPAADLAARATGAARALQAARDTMGRAPTRQDSTKQESTRQAVTRQVTIGLSMLCGARVDACGGPELASIIAAIASTTDVRALGASAPASSIPVLPPVPMPAPDPRRHARAPMQTGTP